MSLGYIGSAKHCENFILHWSYTIFKTQGVFIFTANTGWTLKTLYMFKLFIPSLYTQTPIYIYIYIYLLYSALMFPNHWLIIYSQFECYKLENVVMTINFTLDSCIRYMPKLPI